MALLRIQVARRDAAATSREDDVVNVFYLDDIAVPGDASDLAGLAEDTANLWGNMVPIVQPINEIEVRIYRMAQAEPRAIAGRFVKSNVGSTDASGPREVALCLSFYGTRNLPSQRGRLYVGPFPASMMSVRPSASAIGACVGLANGIKNLGGVDVDWQVYSQKRNLSYDVTNFWVDNEWDTVRSRGLRSTTRTLGVTSEA